MNKWIAAGGYAITSVVLVVASCIVKAPPDSLITGPRLVQFAGAGVVLAAALITVIDVGQLRKTVRNRRLATLGGVIWFVGIIVEFTV